jgi:hypothetical protein
MYKDIDLANATINGQKVLKFYFTAPNDPHVMIHSEYVSLIKLINLGKVMIDLYEDLTGCSIYTVKAFNSYSRL